MRNPRPPARQNRFIGDVSPSTLSSRMQLASAAHQWTIGAPMAVMDTSSNDPNLFVDTLQFLKFTPDEIGRLTAFASRVGQLASVVGWVVAAVSTAKDILEMMGVLEDPDEAQQRIQQDMLAKIDTIYRYLAETERRAELEKSVAWRGLVDKCHNDTTNLASSRSEFNLDALGASARELQTQALSPMLAVSAGDIPFRSANYDGVDRGTRWEITQFPTHWTDYADPLWMETVDGQPVSHGRALDLDTWIWDPAYYLDVLLAAVAARVAALAALEPAFRSTGFDRTDLRGIYSGLRDFVAKWEKSFLQTRVEGPLDPVADPFPPVLGHELHHPYLFVGTHAPGLPVGAIDPVSGVTAFLPLWNEGMRVKTIRTGPEPPPTGDRFVVENYHEAVGLAYDVRHALMRQVRAASGIEHVIALRDSIFNLIGPPGRTEFAEASDVEFRRDPMTADGKSLVSDSDPAWLDLGLLGRFAGAPDRKYKADRLRQRPIKRFRIPIPRRMDASRIQLGYQLRVSAPPGGPSTESGPPLDETIELVAYSAPPFPHEDMALHPSGVITRRLESSQVRVYDAVVSAALTEAEEELFENTGTLTSKQVLYLNDRPGRVVVDLRVSFDFTAVAAVGAFLGFAELEVALPSDPTTDAFILNIDILETKSFAPEDPPRDEIRETVVDTVKLHIAPSFLVAEPDFFRDRAAGYGALGQCVDGLEQRFKISKMILGPLEPITAVERVVEEERLLVTAFERFETAVPEQAVRAVVRYSTPTM